MRTTISVDENLLRSAKRQARRRGLTLGQFIEEAVRRELGRPSTDTPGPLIPVFRDGKGLRPGVDVSSNRALMEALDEGQALERTR